MGGADQRKHKRSRTAFDGIVDASDMSMADRVVNISVSGILCQSSTPIPEMIKVDMAIELPTAQNDPFEVEGTVVRCYPDPDDPTEYLVAITFDNLDPVIWDRIHTYVEYDVPLDEE